MGTSTSEPTPWQSTSTCGGFFSANVPVNLPIIASPRLDYQLDSPPRLQPPEQQPALPPVRSHGRTPADHRDGAAGSHLSSRRTFPGRRSESEGGTSAGRAAGPVRDGRPHHFARESAADGGR